MNQHLDAVTAAVEYIESNLGSGLTLSKVAAHVGYSRFHLHRIFRQTVGLTVHDYIRHRSITEGAKLLVFSSRSIADIALSSGYDSQQAFTGAFRSLYKMSPGAFRERGQFYPLLLGFTPELREPEKALAEAVLRRACEEDVSIWMELLSLAADGLPELRTDKHQKVLRRYISLGNAWILTWQGMALGCMLLEPKNGSIDLMVVHPQLRRGGAMERLLQKAAEELPGDISTTTYREGDRADTGHRQMLEQLGFAERELLTEFGYPTQRMVLKKEKQHE